MDAAPAAASRAGPRRTSGRSPAPELKHLTKMSAPAAEQSAAGSVWAKPAEQPAAGFRLGEARPRAS
jgi:hypothetical protein